jgi:thioredoxin
MITACPRCGAKNRIDEKVAALRQPVCGRCGTRLETGAGREEASRPRVVTDATFAREVLEAGSRPVLLDCWAPWCGPCRMIAPVIDQLAAEADGRYIVAKLNVDENPQTAAQFSIQSIPTLLIFKDGKLIDRMIGVRPKHAIAERLAAYA